MNISWSMMEEFVERHFPNKIKLCMPLFFNAPQHFLGCRRIATRLASLIQEAEMRWKNNVETDIRFIISHLVAKSIISSGVNVYHADSNMAEALCKTSPPDDIMFRDIKMPFEGFIISLPDNFCIGGIPTGVMQIYLSRPPINEPILNGSGWPIIMVRDDANQPGVTLSRAMPADRSVKIIDMPLPEFDGSEPITKDEWHTTSIMCRLAINACLLISEHPAMVDGQEIVYRAKNKFMGAKIDVYSPRWIGRDYKRKFSKDGIGTHLPPRFHWRRGHWRNQAIGTDRKNHKLMWIEPMMVNADPVKI